MFMDDPKEGTNGRCGGMRTSDKSCAQHHDPNEINGRLDMPKADGVAA